MAGYYAQRQSLCSVPAACQGDAKSEAESNKAFWLAGSSPGTSAVLAAKYDLYGGVIVDPKSVPQAPETFRKMLRASLAEWSEAKKRGVWLQLGIESAELIPIATADFGFDFHHAERRHVMLTKWLPTDVPSTLPMNASHTVGVGAIVTDAAKRVLLVREKSGPAARLGIWKLPTGLVDAGEELHVAAVREVKEETGVEATFDHLGAFIMNHGGNLAHEGKSNLFFIVKCSATSTAISADDGEIAEARWFTTEEWHSMDFPEKGSVWDCLNRSALDAAAYMEAKQVAVGNNRKGHRWFYYPSPKSSI